MSAAHFIRDATLARLAYNEGFVAGREEASLEQAAPREDALRREAAMEIDSELVQRRARRAQADPKRSRDRRERTR